MRRRRFPSPELVLAMIVALLPVSCGGCERRVDEPPPPSHARSPEIEPLAKTSASALPETGAKPWGSRCVRESPRVALRPKPRSPDPACPPDPETPPVLKSGKITFEGGQSVVVEVARSDHDRQRGLMYRTSMPDDHGMIFWFEEKENHAFWMHNTCIPLDLLYLDDDGLVVGIEENAPTMSDASLEVGCESKYVLELNAGWTRAHGVKAGQRVKIEGV